MLRDAMRTDERCLIFPTEFGAGGIAWRDSGLTRLLIPERDASGTERRLRGGIIMTSDAAPAWVSSAIVALQDYFTGRPIDFAGIKLDLSGCTDFHKRIYAALQKIGWGKTTTYGALAAAAGAPDAARAIGQAMGRNPLPIIIPCHRVLASGGKIGGFSSPGGATTKERLLALEGVVRPRPETPPLLALLEQGRD